VGGHVPIAFGKIPFHHLGLSPVKLKLFSKQCRYSLIASLIINNLKKTMKPNWGYLTIFSLLLVGLYLVLRLYFGIFTPYNLFTARQDIQKGKIQLIVVGDPALPLIEEKLTKKYGFRYIYTGCLANTELLNGTAIYNKEMKDYLTKKYGSNFWGNHKIQVDSLANFQVE
jgi:hypothetical protein